MTATLPVILARLADELRGAAQDSARLESIVQDALSSQGDRNMVSLPALQDMDLLTQRLADLARFLDVFRASAPDQPIAIDDALAVLHLQALRQGLSGQMSAGSIDAGYVDVF